MASVIIKTVERCNIDCTYCYFFNKKDKSYLKHPPYIKRETIDQIVSFLSKGCLDLKVSDLHVIFHGGEPLMQKKDDFDYMCSKIEEHVKIKDLTFSMQTNLLLIDEAWLQLLNKHNVSVSVSIDGPKVIHDKFRIDKRGRGTFDKTIEKLNYFLQERGPGSVSILSVANPNYPPEMVFDFFYNELEIKQFDFLVPDAHHDDYPELPIKEYGDFYIRLFKKIIHEDSQVRIRFINNIVQSFFGKSSLMYGQGEHPDNMIHPITITSNGDLAPVDDLRNCNPEFMRLNQNVGSVSYQAFLQNSIFRMIERSSQTIPELCQTCIWSKICRGGNIIHRYSSDKIFENPSVYCDALKNIYGVVASQLIKDGYPFSKMQELLNSN